MDFTDQLLNILVGTGMNYKVHVYRSYYDFPIDQFSETDSGKSFLVFKVGDKKVRCQTTLNDYSVCVLLMHIGVITCGYLKEEVFNYQSILAKRDERSGHKDGASSSFLWKTARARHSFGRRR
jgi:hypothetical protein